MLLSFSQPAMLPMLRAGLLQRKLGRAIVPEVQRVKRQTIRRRGPRAEKLLDHARDAGWTIPYDLHLWWKSRTPERELIGVVECGWRSAQPIVVYPITILHSRVTNPDGSSYPILRIDGPSGWRQEAGSAQRNRDGYEADAMLFWSWSHTGRSPSFETEVRADGFDTVEDFYQFFVPRQGDRFDGVLFKW